LKILFLKPHRKSTYRKPPNIRVKGHNRPGHNNGLENSSRKFYTHPKNLLSEAQFKLSITLASGIAMVILGPEMQVSIDVELGRRPVRVEVDFWEEACRV
jgi:hypothetical protein